MTPAAYPFIVGGAPAPFVHPVLGALNYQITEVSDDPDTQVAQTIDLMRRYASEDSANPILLQDVATAAQGDPVDDTWRYISRKDGVRSMHFVHDESTGAPWADLGRWRPIVETLMRPCDQAVVSQPMGDCDDFAMYGAAHLLARGVACSFVTVAADAGDPTIYSHVYLVAYPKAGKYAGRRVPLDLSHGSHAGWETSNKYGKRREWPIGGSVTTSPVFWGWLAAGGYILYRMCGGLAW